MRNTYLFLCDYSGIWSQPYRDAGHRTIQVDPKLHHRFRKDTQGNFYLSMTAQAFLHSNMWRGMNIRGVVMMPPCTDFTISGNQYWPAKDEDGRTASSMEIVAACLDIKDNVLRPDGWWVLENPVGRLPTLFPERLGKARVFTHPYKYAGFSDNPEAEAFTKKTGLWGKFSTALPESPLDPVMYTTKNGKRGSWMWAKLGGKSERTKELRSMTPQGFARAFHMANP